MESSFIKIAKAGINDQGKRADTVIRKILPSLQLGIIYREIRKGRVRINGKKIIPGYRIGNGDSVDLHRSLAVELRDDVERLSLKPVEETGNTVTLGNMPEVIFENNMILVVNKPAGISVHAEDRKDTITLDLIIKSRYKNITGESLAFSTAPLHRLDKNTSGILFFSKSIEGARIFTSLLREKKIIKRYIALLDGHLEKPYKWTDFLTHDRIKRSAEKSDSIRGEQTVTSVSPLLYSGSYTLASAEIETGRYHQIRKQCAMHGYPLTGDIKYGGSYGAVSRAKGVNTPGYLLHCYSVEIISPELSEKLGIKSLTAPPPESFLAEIEDLFTRKDIESIFSDITESQY